MRFAFADHRYLGAVIVYCLLNLLFFTRIEAYHSLNGELLENGDFSQGTQGWRLRGDAAGITLERGVLSIDHPKATSTTLSQCRPTTTMPQPLLLSAAARSSGVVRGAQYWHRARIDLVGYDAGGMGLYRVPTRLVSLEGDRPWRNARALFRLPAEALRVCLEISLHSAAGRFQIRHLSMTQGVESTLHRIGRPLLLVGWMGLALWLLPPVYRRYRRRHLGRWLLLIGALILVGVLLPQELRQQIEAGIAMFLQQIGLPLTSVDAPDIERDWALWPAAWDISKYAHLLGFLLLSMLLAADREIDTWRRVSVLVALAMVTEILQFFVPMRTPRLSDLVVDGLGMGIGLGLAAIWFRVSRKFLIGA